MSVLRPRDIQTRIRAGETPEDVAAVAQTSVDKIMGFATPVLAERAYQAQLAQRASVRRRAATGHVGNLGAAVTSHLETVDVDPDSVEWDAWRREDGRWTVVAAYVAHGEHHQAAFSYDVAGRFVVAEDDGARALVGERVAGSASAAAAVPEQPTGLAADPLADPLDDLLAPRHPEGAGQLPLGDDAISLVTGVRRAPAAEPEEAAAPPAADLPTPDAHDDDVPELQGEVTVDLTDTSAAVRAVGPPSTADADWIATQASERPAPPAPGHHPAGEAEPWDRLGEDDGLEPGDVHAPDSEHEAADTLFDVPSEQQGPARATRPRGRASVPSWDEIMFGTPKSE